MRAELRRAAKAFAFYLLALAVVAAGYVAIGHYGLAHVVANAALGAGKTNTAAEKTRLELVVDNARAIKAALAKPIAPPEPLGPVQNKAAHTLGGPTAARVAVKQEKKPSLSAEAANAFASSSTSTSYEAYDRHRPM
jgi:hypothetical protein